MAVLLITGANGQLGCELKDASRNYYGYDFIFTDIDTLDLSDKAATSAFIEKAKPDWIINCAAYNFVDKAEAESVKAMLVNATAVRNIGESIIGTDCRFIHLSSDYVFNGESNVPYNEGSETDPRSVYGRSKLEGEKAALMHHATMVIRTSWLYSSYGQNFLKTILAKAKEKDSISVVFDQTGTPTWAGDLADAIMTIVSGVIRNQYAFTAGIYNYSNEGVCSWYDFALAITEEAGLSCRVYPVLTCEYPSVANRPQYSVLNKNKIKDTYNINIPHWRNSLKKCMRLMI
jgi:dTDP-4-dehydrorhamnose reductase